MALVKQAGLQVTCYSTVKQGPMSGSPRTSLQGGQAVVVAAQRVVAVAACGRARYRRGGSAS